MEKVDLTALKRAIENAEKFNGTPAVVDNAKDTVVAVVDLLKAWQGVYNTGVADRSDEFNTFIDKTQTIVNGCIEKINGIEGLLHGIDVDTLNKQLSAVTKLLEGDGVANILTSLDSIADVLNKVRIEVAYPVTFKATDGIEVIDITSLGFADVTDYEVSYSKNSKAPVDLTVKKESASQVKIIALDTRCWADNEVPFDASEHNFDLTVKVSYKPANIATTLVETDGDNFVVGEEVGAGSGEAGDGEAGN